MSRILIRCMVSILLAGGLAAAQETVPPAEPSPAPSDPVAAPSRAARYEVDVESWIAQPAGLGYVPAIRMGDTASANQVLEIPHGTKSGMRYGLGYNLGRNLGTVRFSYWSHSDSVPWAEMHAGDFTLSQALTSPFLAGVSDDGMADGVTSLATTSTRDVRLGFSRAAFEGPRLRGRWSLGLRSVDHDRVFDAQYHTLIPPFPALTPPVPTRTDLAPEDDIATLESRFSGRGLDAGVELTFPIGRRVTVEGAASLAVLRGRTDYRYRSLTHAYGVFDGDDLLGLLASFDLLSVQTEEGWIIDRVRQIPFEEGLQRSGLSSTASVLETSVGVRWNAWRGLDVFGGFRNTRYADVALDARPSDFFQLQQSTGSVDYEGLYLGVGYRY